jgi:hypothetical protein
MGNSHLETLMNTMLAAFERKKLACNRQSHLDWIEKIAKAN